MAFNLLDICLNKDSSYSSFESQFLIKKKIKSEKECIKKY